MRIELIAQGPESKQSVEKCFATLLQSNIWIHLHVAAAYATVPGVWDLLTLIQKSKSAEMEYEWAIGLDHYLTHPGALKICGDLENSVLKVAAYRSKKFVFHPKVYFLTSKNRQGAMIVGSANLTRNGFTKNVEGCTALIGENANDLKLMSDYWKVFWNLARIPTSEDLDKYKTNFVDKYPKDIVDEDDETEKHENEPIADPSLAATCWIEVGRNTGKGHELEFKAEQALFFDLSPSEGGGAKQFRTFVPSSGEKVTLPLRYQENGMWRLQMNAGIPEVATSLRPRNEQTGKLGRSPYVAVFSRSDDPQTYFLKFIRDDSGEYAELRRLSAGSSGMTSARRFGWC